MKTNFDNYLDKQVKDPAFARRFRQAGEAWDIGAVIAKPGRKRRMSAAGRARIAAAARARWRKAKRAGRNKL
jgi:hypothetical protein